MAKFLLSSLAKKAPQEEIIGAEGLGALALIGHLRWFIKLRWIIVGILTAAATTSTFLPEWLESLGFASPRVWPWVLAASVAVANIGFHLCARVLNPESRPRTVKFNMWTQILLDLIAVTVLVHFVGSTSTFIPFIYVLHIVCACIFFPPKQSFLVAAIASLLYVLCVSLELNGIWSKCTILLNPSTVQPLPWLHPVFAASAIIVWFAVWYLVETLATAVVERDNELQFANKQLMKADEEKNKLVLRTTHDLKAPFSGIESNIQVLRLQCGEELSEKAREIIERIEKRSRSLSERIKDILLLGEIRSDRSAVVNLEIVDIPEVIDQVMADLEEKAKQRKVTLDTKLMPLELIGNSRHYFILFQNLISNAITYSHEGGTVTVAMHNGDLDCHVTVADTGIGINEDALPHIFDEYYRTSDAASFNSKSTGLGLSIVQEIAQREGLDIEVTSVKGEGTQFDVYIPGDYCSFRHKQV